MGYGGGTAIPGRNVLVEAGLFCSECPETATSGAVSWLYALDLVLEGGWFWWDMAVILGWWPLAHHRAMIDIADAKRVLSEQADS